MKVCGFIQVTVSQNKLKLFMETAIILHSNTVARWTKKYMVTIGILTNYL